VSSAGAIFWGAVPQKRRFLSEVNWRCSVDARCESDRRLTFDQTVLTEVANVCEGCGQFWGSLQCSSCGDSCRHLCNLALRPRYGAGFKAELWAGIAMWCLGYPLASVTPVALNLFPACLMVVGLAVGLLEAWSQRLPARGCTVNRVDESACAAISSAAFV
jgi:hypothetical protein